MPEDAANPPPIPPGNTPPVAREPSLPRAVRNEFRCVSCNYVIRGMRLDELCPECGTPVAHSVGVSKPASGSAVASLVLGILSIVGCTTYGVLSVILGPLAIYFASKAKHQVVQGEASPNSAGLARAGLICGIIGTTLGVVVVGFMAFMILMAMLGP